APGDVVPQRPYGRDPTRRVERAPVSAHGHTHTTDQIRAAGVGEARTSPFVRAHVRTRARGDQVARPPPRACPRSAADRWHVTTPAAGLHQRMAEAEVRRAPRARGLRTRLRAHGRSEIAIVTRMSHAAGDAQRVATCGRSSERKEINM